MAYTSTVTISLNVSKLLPNYRASHPGIFFHEEPSQSDQLRETELWGTTVPGHILTLVTSTQKTPKHCKHLQYDMTSQSEQSRHEDQECVCNLSVSARHKEGSFHTVHTMENVPPLHLMMEIDPVSKLLY
jgi:hypothetical protein